MKFSIVTPALNSMRFLPRTAQSILSQADEVELEWIVIDGGSTDGTQDFLRSLSGNRCIRWFTDRDNGQSHAINRGLCQAKGDIVAWLNSDDLYTAAALAAVKNSFEERSAAQWLVGQCDIIDAEDHVIRSQVTRYKNRGLASYSRRRLLRENFISQPAVFWRREFGQQAGELDESLHYAMDYDLWLRMSALSEPVIVSQTLAKFRLHVGSKSGRVRREQFDEQYRVARRYVGRDRVSQAIHKFNIEKIVAAYRMMRGLGW